jgi:hypothetical protein
LGVARHRYVANPWHIAVEMFVGFAHDGLSIRYLSFCVTANPARRPVAFYQQRIKFTPQIGVYLQHIHLFPLLFVRVPPGVIFAVNILPDVLEKGVSSYVRIPCEKNPKNPLTKTYSFWTADQGLEVSFCKKVARNVYRLATLSA